MLRNVGRRRPEGVGSLGLAGPSRAYAVRRERSRQRDDEGHQDKEKDDNVPVAMPLHPIPPVFDNPTRGYLEPQPLEKTHGVPVGLLHLRSYHVDLLKLFTHFAMHSAVSLGIPTSGVASLPTKRNLWTVIRSPFVHKKSQENFERRTHKRAIKLWDASPDVLEMYISYLEKNALAGVGLRTVIYQRADVGFGAQAVKTMTRLGIITEKQKDKWHKIKQEVYTTNGPVEGVVRRIIQQERARTAQPAPAINAGRETLVDANADVDEPVPTAAPAAPESSLSSASVDVEVDTADSPPVIDVQEPQPSTAGPALSSSSPSPPSADSSTPSPASPDIPPPTLGPTTAGSPEPYSPVSPTPALSDASASPAEPNPEPKPVAVAADADAVPADPTPESEPVVVAADADADPDSPPVSPEGTATESEVVGRDEPIDGGAAVGEVPSAEEGKKE